MNETIQIKGMSCNGCVNGVKRALGKLSLDKAQVEIGRALVEYDPAKVNRQQIVSAIEAAGFAVEAAAGRS